MSQTKRGSTGQYLDDTGLLFYTARYFDPGIGRFISADSIVPGDASGGMDGIALKPLTVDFHEPGFVGKLNSENQFGPWFTLSGKEKQQLGSPMGPANPQALNRYSYTLNNPVRYVDPSGHLGVTIHDNGHITLHLTREEAGALLAAINEKDPMRIMTLISSLATILGMLGLLPIATMLIGALLTAIQADAVALEWADELLGGNGVDLTFTSQGTLFSVERGTVDRQQGVHYDPLMGCIIQGQGCPRNLGDPCPDRPGTCGDTGVVPQPRATPVPSTPTSRAAPPANRGGQ